MKIVALKEREKFESRVAITPETSKLFVNLGYEVVLEKDLGLESGYSNNEYIDSGAKISSIPLEILSDADIILKVKPSPLDEKFSEHEFSKENALILGLFNPHFNHEIMEHYSKKKLSVFAMEMVPRTTKAQSMDVLSSQANLAGYRAVIEAIYIYQKSLPMFMTAAGTLNPAKVLVLGAGVAGLQAIATAKRLGAIVYAYDVRAAAKEQVESLGGRFIHPSLSEDFSGDGGYAKEVDENFAKLQEKMLTEEIPKMDIVISTAQIPGRKAPILITKSMAASMNEGSIIVDLATSSGGNCEVSIADSIIKFEKVKIIGFSNIASRIAHDASKLYAKNLFNLIKYFNFIQNPTLNLEDDIVKSMLVSYQGNLLINKS